MRTKNKYWINIEEHNINSTGANTNSESREEIRDQFRAIYQAFYGVNHVGSAEQGDVNTTLLQLLSQLIPENLQEEWLQSMDSTKSKGCSDTFIDSLPRVTSKTLKQEDTCAICCSNFLDDEYPLVVKLPNCGHMFDFECVAMWLSKNTTCPMCRDNVTDKKEFQVDTSKLEIEEDWGMYG